MRIDCSRFLALSVALLTVSAVAATPPPASASKPVYLPTFISSDDREGCLVAVKNRPVANGALMRGVCTPRLNSRDAMVYSAWPSFAALQSQTEGWTSSSDFASLRRINHLASWVALNDFEARPPAKEVNHVFRFEVKPEDLAVFVAAVAGTVNVRLVHPNAQ